MKVISVDTSSGAHITEVQYDGRTYRKYTHACRNTPRRVVYDVKQLLHVVAGGPKIKSIKVL